MGEWVIKTFRKYPWALFCLDCGIFIPYSIAEHCHHLFKEHTLVSVSS